MRWISILAAVGLTAGLVMPSPVCSSMAEGATPAPETGGQGEATSAPVRPPAASQDKPSVEKLAIQHCSVCHSFQLVESQRLNRANWEWVMDDMVNKYGAVWISKEDQERIIDYLVERYGPEK